MRTHTSFKSTLLCQMHPSCNWQVLFICSSQFRPIECDVPNKKRGGIMGQLIWFFLRSGQDLHKGPGFEAHSMHMIFFFWFEGPELNFCFHMKKYLNLDIKHPMQINCPNYKPVTNTKVVYLKVSKWAHSSLFRILPNRYLFSIESLIWKIGNLDFRFLYLF